MIFKLTLAILLTITTFSAQAATKVPWEWTMVIVGVISAVIATIITRRNKKADTLGLKVLLGGLYFWVITFAQTIILALVYQLFIR